MKIMSNANQANVASAALALKNGRLVAFPTETVYGLGADASNKKAISRIYSVKARPLNHPLIVHVSTLNTIHKWSRDIPKYAEDLADVFWPGPMTLVLKRSKLAKSFITGGQDNVGLRIPEHSLALDLLQEFEKLGGLGVAAPSANRFGAVSPTTAAAVKEELECYLEKKDLILDGGACRVGVESTIIDCTSESPTVLRPGAVTLEMIRNVTCLEVTLASTKKDIRAPGLLSAHYAPKAQVILDVPAEPGDGFIAFANVSTPKGAIRLASPTNIQDYAINLYGALRLGDQYGLKRIAILPPTGDGLATAIRDRLDKAASGSFVSNKR